MHFYKLYRIYQNSISKSWTCLKNLKISKENKTITQMTKLKVYSNKITSWTNPYNKQEKYYSIFIIKYIKNVNYIIFRIASGVQKSFSDQKNRLSNVSGNLKKIQSNIIQIFKIYINIYF